MINRLYFFLSTPLISKTKIKTVPPRWILEPTDKAFAQGSNAKVECKSDGFPKPQITWKKAVGRCNLIQSQTNEQQQ